jgi:hypothetical protein
VQEKHFWADNDGDDNDNKMMMMMKLSRSLSWIKQAKVAAIILVSSNKQNLNYSRALCKLE